MYVSENIEIIPARTIQYNDFKLRWSFDGNSSVLSLFTYGDSCFSSDHWMSENSDILSFDHANKLLSLDLLIPNDNKHISILSENISFGEIVINNPEYIVNPMEYRFFDPDNKKLFCFSSFESSTNYSTVRLHDNFSLILVEQSYSGFIIDDPIIFLTDDKEGKIDSNIAPSDDEYNIMTEFMHIMSDNHVEELEDDMSHVVRELYTKLNPKLALIKSDLRRKLLKKVLDDLLDYYSNW